MSLEGRRTGEVLAHSKRKKKAKKVLNYTKRASARPPSYAATCSSSRPLLTPACCCCCCTAPAPVTPTTSPFNHPFSLLNASHSFSSSLTLTSSSFAFFSSAASLSFFFNRKRADAAVFLRLLSSAAVTGVLPYFSASGLAGSDSCSTDTERVVLARLGAGCDVVEDAEAEGVWVVELGGWDEADGPLGMESGGRF